MTFRAACVCLIFWAVAGPVAAGTGDPIGSVKTLDGSAMLVRGARFIPVRVGTLLYENDVMQTGENSTAGIMMRDDSTVSLGAEARIALAGFAFEPAQGKFSFVVRLSHGAAVFAAGQIARLAPESARVETPVATVGFQEARFAVRVEGH